MHDIIATLCNRRYTEKCIGYSESHDQSIVGDKTVAFWLMDAEMYDGMSTFEEPTDVVSRGMALHKMIRMITMAIGGEGYLNFMGNEFGHPEWVDFPREGNKWKHDHCRRQWSLADTEHLRYFELNNFDKALMQLEEKFGFMSHEHQFVSMACEERKVIVAERGPLLFVFNFHPTMSYEGLEVGLGMPGKYRICLDTDAWSFGGAGRVGHDEDHFTSPGGPNTFVGPYEQEPRPCALKVLSPSRSAQVFYKVPEDEIDMSLNVGAGENVHNLRQPGGLRVEPIGSVPPPRSNAPPPPPPPPPPASNAVGMQRSSVAVDPDQYDPENASRGMARSAPAPAQTSFNHPATPVGAATYVAKKQLMDDPDQYDPENASRGMARSAQQPAAQTSFGHPAATYVAKKQLMDDPDQFDPENASRGKSRSAAAPSSYGTGGSSAAPSSFGGYGKAAAPSRVTRASDGVVYDPDQYDPNP
jgi:1,4-alpha-glucan branching enzyme